MIKVLGYTVETSGIDSKLTSVLQFAAVELTVDTRDWKIEVSKKFNRFYYPQFGRVVDDWALNVNELTNEKIKEYRKRQKADYPLFFYKDKEVFDLLYGYYQNTKYPVGFLKDIVATTWFANDFVMDSLFTLNGNWTLRSFQQYKKSVIESYTIIWNANCQSLFFQNNDREFRNLAKQAMRGEDHPKTLEKACVVALLTARIVKAVASEITLKTAKEEKYHPYVIEFLENIRDEEESVHYRMFKKTFEPGAVELLKIMGDSYKNTVDKPDEIDEEDSPF